MCSFRHLLVVLGALVLGALFIGALTLSGESSRRIEPARFAGDNFAFQNADLLFVRGTSWRARIVRLLGGRDEEFSHVGIISTVEETQVIHATPTAGNGSGEGVVVSEDLNVFLSRGNFTVAALFRIKQAESNLTEAAVTKAQQLAIERVPFDHQFSLSSTDRLYCTELVLEVFRSVGVELLSFEQLRGRILLPSTLAESAEIELIAVYGEPL